MSTPAVAPRLALHKIVYATDFSPASQAALPFVKGIARQFGAEVFVTHVFPYELPLDDAPSLANERTAAESRMSAFLHRYGLSEPTYRAVLEPGDVCVAISEFVIQNQIDLIVAGTRGRGAISDFLLGSAAEAIIRCSPCPVLTVGPQVLPVRADGGFGHILLATDFSPGSELALAWAAWWAGRNGAHLAMLHVVEDFESSADRQGPRQKEVQVSVHERFRNMLSSSAELREAPELRVEYGAAGDMILEVGADVRADLIVMGAQRSRMPHVSAHAPWRTLHHVIGRAYCPVLTVPLNGAG